jgi:hypothetical protein
MRPYALLALVIAASAHGQRKIVPSQIGILYRYQGDTIWHERDSSMTRTVFRGDTIRSERWQDGRRISSTVHVVAGDSGRMVSNIDSTGAEGRTGVSVPARLLYARRDMIAMQMRSADARAKMSQRGYGTRVPVSPSSSIGYCIESGRSIVHQADTARDIRTREGRADTTIYLFVGDTTVRRLSPSPRTFGYAMYNTLFGEMHMSIVHRNLAGRSSPLEQELPGRPSDSCNKR